MPFDVLSGFLAGQLRTMAADKDDIWSFSPFIDQSIFRLIRRNLPRPRLFDWQIMFFYDHRRLALRANGIGRDIFRRSIFSIESPDNFWVWGAIYAASVTAIGIEIKDLQQRPHPDQAGGAGAAAAARPHGGAAEPDQSALPVQHAEFDFVAGALRSRHGARSDHQAGQRFCGAC